MKRKPPIIPLSQTGLVLVLFPVFLIVILFLTSCSGQAIDRAAYQPERASVSLLVDTDSVEETVLAEDGSTLAACAYQLPVMSVLRRDGTLVEDASGTEERSALERAETFNGAFRRWAEEADFPALADAARQDSTWRQEAGTPWEGYYSQTLECSVYQTDRLASVSGRFYYYGGGAHPNRACLGWNFDKAAGTFLSAAQFFSNTEAVAEELVRQAEDRAAESGYRPEQMYWADYQTILSGWAEDTAAVTFDGQSMTVSWSPYDLASYAAGEQVFTLSLDALRPYLSEYGREVLGIVE